jgi:hypothetical protein
LQFKASHCKWLTRPYLNNTWHKKGLAKWLQAVECLYSKHEALSSNSSTTKKFFKKLKKDNVLG